MLRRLFIRDFVIVDQLELEFAGGFGALTGETGAGKSILVDALSIVLGDKAGEVVRAGCSRAEVSAEFDVGPAVADWLTANDYASDECLLRRVIEAGSRSRAWINGTPATLSQLRELGELLCDIHGQHAHQSLLRSEAQRALLDAQSNASALAREVMEAHRTWRHLLTAQQAAERDAAASAQERELLDWQIRELEALAFDPAAWQETEAEHRRLANGAALIAGCEAALTALDGEAADALAQSAARLKDLAEVDGALAEPAGLLEAAIIGLGEAAHALRRYRDRADLDPARLEEIEARIDAVTQLARKHRTSPEELPACLARLRARAAELALLANPQALAEQVVQVRQHYLSLAGRLSEIRRATAERLSAQVTEAMQGLALAGGRFAIALEPLDEGAAHGLENIVFQIAANQGQPLRPLAKVASGGELSRIGLAIQVIASQAAGVDTLIFDEVDVGIGGGVAEVVGRLLRQLGGQRQVLCVTHLPQVAAQAHWQWSIRKQAADGVTLSRVLPLDETGRIEEIARMLGGVSIGETTRRHAREMLQQAGNL